jgi:hypothetical protein
MSINYEKTVGMMVLNALSSGEKDKRADLIVQLGRGIADIVGVINSKKDMEAMLEVVFDCIRTNAAISSRLYQKAAESLEAASPPTEPAPEPDGESVSAEEFLAKHFKPEKFNA